MLCGVAKLREMVKRRAPEWGRRNTCAVLIVSLIIATAAAFVQHTNNIPLIDDWTYAWSVEHFLTTGKLRVLDWSAHYPLAQIVWGALFAYVDGFSFFALSVSTLVLNWIGLLAFFLTLRTVGVSPFYSALGTLTLFFNPVMFVLGHSFMTDVPFVSVMNVTILFYVLWVKRGSSVYLGLGSVFALVSFLIRQIGGVLLLVPLASLLLSRFGGERRALSWRQLLLLLFPFLGVGLTQWWIRDVHGLTSVYLQKAEALNYLFSASSWLSSGSWWVYFNGMVHALVHLGLVLWPLALVSLLGRTKGMLLLSLVIVVLITGLYRWHYKKLPRPPLAYGQTLSLQELGASRPLIHGRLKPEMPAWTVWALLGFSLTSAIAIIVALLEGIRHTLHWLGQPGTVLVINGFWQFLAILSLWLYYDRYYLPLLPGLIALLFSAIKPTRIATAVIVTGTLMFGVISVTGTIDNFRFNSTVSNAREWLLEQGVAPSQIDAGYAFNGWWLYAHPENLPQGARPESDVPFVTSKTKLPYLIANSPMPSYEVMRDFTWQSLWAASNRIYVLHKSQAATRITATRNPGSVAAGTR
jgi:hypothetical protein